MSHQVIAFNHGLTGGWHPDDQVALAAQAVEKRVEGREQCRKHRISHSCAGILQVCHEVRSATVYRQRTIVTFYTRPRSVRWQIQHRNLRILEFLKPELLRPAAFCLLCLSLTPPNEFHKWRRWRQVNHL